MHQAEKELDDLVSKISGKTDVERARVSLMEQYIGRYDHFIRHNIKFSEHYAQIGKAYQTRVDAYHKSQEEKGASK